ncbi:hypothetical protein AGMMS50268_41270 [Spirochaetia bacterium]|nr:hypothetical protein AGMMS50268_41270 [Spirochaetia bacterium]
MGDTVYLWKVDGRVVAHTDLGAAAQLDGLSREPDKQVTAAEWSAAGGLARIIDGDIFLGKTDEEKQAEENTSRVAQLKKYLFETDYIAAKIAEGAATKEEYTDMIEQRAAWRAEIEEKIAG